MERAYKRRFNNSGYGYVYTYEYWGGVMKNIQKYKLSKDKKGLLAYIDKTTYFHIHSDELSILEKWIKKILEKTKKG